MKTNLFSFLLFLFFFAQAQLQENTWYKVSKITDGDTFMSQLHHQKNIKSD